ncbi:MAG: bifunctional [glutamine synthetase] adenylyltransferase/[glutamine synthetase]-adenylyl-L-tyrosine phosphorylase [Acidimicrobiales bacterium]
MPGSVPQALLDLATRSAAPDRATIAIVRLATERPDRVERFIRDGEPTRTARAFVAVVAASDSLGRFCITHPATDEVLGDLDRRYVIETAEFDERTIALQYRLDLLCTAARDLLGLDRFETVVAQLSETASRVLESAVRLAGMRSGQFAVIGMGKLGGNELNYASDVDLMFVTAPSQNDEGARKVVDIARQSFRVDIDLRPEGRSGPLTRNMESYLSYWTRWAEPWEFQALIKARAVAGDGALGETFTTQAEGQVWDRTYSADELALIRRLKERSEALIASKGMTERELKRGPGGIRDVEFAVQLLQLVHGRRDPSIRSRSTLGALGELAASGYVDADQAASLSDAYRFLRTVEHRVQLVEEQQTHTIPNEPSAKERLARVLGFEPKPGHDATALFDEALRVCRTEVRSLHERLFFRPLLEAFSTVPSDVRDKTGTIMSPDRIAERLEAFGFAGPKRTKAAVDELAQGLTRSSRLMDQMLPLLLDWLSTSPDPDLGLLGLRNLALHAHNRSRLITTFRESPEAARRLCLLLGTSRTLAEALNRNPELVTRLGDDRALEVGDARTLTAELDDLLAHATGPTEDGGAEMARRRRMLRFRQEQLIRIATRDLLRIDDAPGAEKTLSNVAEVLLQAALDEIDPAVPFCVVALGSFGGGELSYASDLDVIFVHNANEDIEGESTAEKLLRVLHGPSPAERIFSVDLGLRPEGGHGRLSRDIDGYSLYFERWAQTWERQALLRARVVAGDRALGEEFLRLAHSFIWNPSIGPDEIAEIRRMKARIERERIPAGEDPQFHLKLGRGSLSDVEWTVQLLQLRSQVEGAATMGALSQLERVQEISPTDAAALRDAYLFCERTRNRWHLVGALPGGASPGDSLPTQAPQLSRLSRSLGTTPASLRDEYRKLTRRSRRVMEHLFYGIEQPEGAG